MTESLPENASVATELEGEKLFAPSAARNAYAIAQVVAQHAPPSGTALEIASGTGQHVVALASACPDLGWHPTEIDAARLASINAYAAGAGLENIAEASHLDATAKGWGQAQGPYRLAVFSNLVPHCSHGGEVGRAAWRGRG